MKKWQKVLILCVSCVCLLATMIIPTFAYTIDTDNYKVIPTYTEITSLGHQSGSDTYNYGFNASYSEDYNSPKTINCKSTDWLEIYISTSSNRRSDWECGMVRLAYSNHSQRFTVKDSAGAIVFYIDVTVPTLQDNEYRGYISVNITVNPQKVDTSAPLYVSFGVFPSYSAYASYIKQMVGDVGSF